MENETVSKNFIENIIDKDLAEGVYDTVHTRFPPEPNGYLHIGHAKSILLNYGLAQEYNGKFNMRFDDTNPTKEKSEFVESIKADIKWLGADWEDRLFFASDYFEQMYEAAVKLIQKGKAYVCDLTADQIREYRGTLTEPGKESPYRNRSVEENLQLFEEMKEGKYADGEKVLRAKIDMASPNMNMRDPVIYRVAHMTHHRTGDTWCIYPMYDFAHPIEDAIEGITHSICTLEFEDHRPLYDWVVKELEYPQPPKQIEFAKLYLTNVVTGKRYIKNSHQTWTFQFQILTDAVFKHCIVNRAVCFGYTAEFYKHFDGFRCKSTAAQCCDGNQTRIIPSVYDAFFYQTFDVTFSGYHIGQVQFCEFDLFRRIWIFQFSYHPVV